MFLAIGVGSISGVFGSLFSSKLVMLASKDGTAGLVMGLVGSIQNLLEIPAGAIIGNLLAYAQENYPPTSMEAGFPYFIVAVVSIIPVVHLFYLDRKYATREGWRSENILFQHQAAVKALSKVPSVALIDEALGDTLVSLGEDFESGGDRTDDVEMTTITTTLMDETLPGEQTPRPRHSTHSHRGPTPTV